MQTTISRPERQLANPSKTKRKYERLVPHVPVSKHTPATVRPMWDRYCQVKSLTQVAKEFGISRENIRYQFIKAKFDHKAFKASTRKKLLTVSLLLSEEVVAKLKAKGNGKLATAARAILEEAIAS